MSLSAGEHTARAAGHAHVSSQLWEDHVTWTRLAIVAFADGSPGFDATAERLLAETRREPAGDYRASVADYETIHAHILEMADLLSNGILRSFPARFR